jgi:hypothetical protein
MYTHTISIPWGGEEPSLATSKVLGKQGKGRITGTMVVRTKKGDQRSRIKGLNKWQEGRTRK